MSQAQTPEATPATQTADDATRAAAAKALLDELHRKTQKVIADHPDLLKPQPDGPTAK